MVKEIINIKTKDWRIVIISLTVRRGRVDFVEYMKFQFEVITSAYIEA